jgi:basic amino acid/polyamine antiporter, APA family
MAAHMAAPDRASRPSDVTLERALGRWDLTAIGINQVIGSAVFLMPSQVAAAVGAWSPLAVLAGGMAALAVGLCFAEAGSRFEGTGGAYLYTRAAFGRFISFEVGWMAWFTRTSSQAAVAAGLTLALGFYFPSLAHGWGRAVVISVITLLFGAITLAGVRQSAWTVNTLTIAKLLPLALFLVAGLSHADASRLMPFPMVTFDQAMSAGLLLIFVYGGFEVIGVPAGESTDPRRHVPFALVVTILTVTLIYTLVQLAAEMTLPNLAASTTPVADSALATMGSTGALIVGLGSMLAMSGNIMGQILSGSRFLYALGEHGDLPRWFARVHPRFRTPSNAVVFTTLVALGLSLSGSFVALASAAAVARLLVYAGTCCATLALRRPRWAGRAGPATFTIPLGPAVPVVGLLLSLMVAFGASRQQLAAGLAFLVLGAALYRFGRQEPRG